MRKPVLLDLFCGAGGAAEGYRRAGFYVIGVDHVDQPRYRGDEFVQADVFTFLQGDLRRYAAIHASPPCQAYSPLRRLIRRTYPDLIAPLRRRLEEIGLPYMIENVPQAPLKPTVWLCGTMFGLRVFRHRSFETTFFVPQPIHGPHGPLFSYDKRKPHRATDPWQAYLSVTGGTASLAAAKDAMGIDWMRPTELAEAIPPAYTEHIGRWLMIYLEETS